MRVVGEYSANTLFIDTSASRLYALIKCDLVASVCMKTETGQDECFKYMGQRSCVWQASSKNQNVSTSHGRIFGVKECVCPLFSVSNGGGVNRKVLRISWARSIVVSNIVRLFGVLEPSDPSSVQSAPSSKSLGNVVDDTFGPRCWRVDTQPSRQNLGVYPWSCGHPFGPHLSPHSGLISRGGDGVWRTEEAGEEGEGGEGSTPRFLHFVS